MRQGEKGKIAVRGKRDKAEAHGWRYGGGRKGGDDGRRWQR